MQSFDLLHDVTSESGKTSCIKIDKPPIVVYIVSSYVMMSVTTLRTCTL